MNIFWAYAQAENVKRIFSSLQIFCMSFNVIAIVPSIASVLVVSIPGGGTHGMIWAWLVCGIFMTVISLAIAEVVSATPNAGGAYKSTLIYSPSISRRLLSWISGYANTIGNITTVASIAWACALQIMAASMIGSGFMFQPTMAQTYGIFCGLLIFQGVACSLNPVILARLQLPFLVLSVSLWLALIISLPTTSTELNTTKFVFGTFTNGEYFPSLPEYNVFAFLLTFLSPLWVLGRATSTVHISEESKNVKTTVPYAIVVSTATTAIMGWGLNIVLAFCMGNDLRAILFSQSGEPMATILLNSFGTKGMLAAWTFVIILQFNMGLTMLSNTRRQISAFSRDGAFNCSLFSRRLSSINSLPNTSNIATWLPIMISMVLGLLAFAGTSAVCRTLFSSAVVSQFVAYTIAIIGSRFGSASKSDRRKSAFSLGILSLPVAVASTIVMVVLSVILLFPDTEHPSGGTMNYTAAILGGTLVLALTDFYFAKCDNVTH
ncbi:amino acid/polyamine transporter I [Pholiota molesta]|nr:amino acid/polyamine transporter I [Pholiota molesta]